MKAIKYTTALLATIAVTAALTAGAADPVRANPYLGVLSSVSSAELPGKTAELVGQADAKARPQATVDAVKSAVGLNPAAAASIVGSIAQVTPAMAAIAAGTAVSLVPDQAQTIARAAAAAAPKQAGKIVEAICRVLPTAYKKVAAAVAEVVPGADKAILTGIATAIPALKDPINAVLVADMGSSPTVSKVLEQIGSPTISKYTSPMTPTPMTPGISPGPTQPPYVPISGTPGNVDPGSAGQVPNGGRQYSSP